jgi:CheY-like chemotaxis protein
MTPKTKSVFIADDDRELVAALSSRIERLGLKVYKAFDAVSALQAIHSARPDLVILDVSMPAGNGLSVCEMMATDPNLSTVPVIILTGRQDQETIKRCWDMCVYYVLKCPDVWPRVEPLVYELVDVDPPERCIISRDIVG